MKKAEKIKLDEKYQKSKTPYDEELKMSIKRLSYLRSELKSEEIRYKDLKQTVEGYENGTRK